MAHIDGDEYEITIEMKGISKQGDRVPSMKVIFVRPGVIVSKGSRIILRKGETTIAFGKVTLVKPYLKLF